MTRRQAEAHVRYFTIAALAACVTLTACMDATDVELIEIDATGFLFGVAFLDLNGNRALDATDSLLANVQVVLTASASGDPVVDATTGQEGGFLMENVPVGAYTLGLDQDVLGDSLFPVGPGAGPVTIELDDTTRIDLAASYPQLTLEEVRTAAPGRRVFTAGIALSQRPSPDPVGQVHFASDGAYLRALNVERLDLSVGDSVRLLGRTGLDAGQPVLETVTPFVLVQVATVPVAVDASTAEAAEADGGPLDAALVRIQRADITDTFTVDGDFHVRVDDGSGPVDIVLRSFLGLATQLFRPDTVVRVQRATGLLTPFEDATGTVSWRLLPRAGADIAVQNKVADVSITTSFDPETASQGETVEIVVTATNAGPDRATGVQVADTVPAGLTFVSSDAMGGSYEESESLWTVGDLDAGATATLRIQVEVTSGAPGDIENRAWLQPLLTELEQNAQNNDDDAVLTVS